MPSVVGKDPEYIKRVTCKKCASVIEYTTSEMTYIKHSFDWYGDYETSLGFKCPSCKNNVFPTR